MTKSKDLSNDEFFTLLRTHVSTGHAWQACQLAYLVEAEDRRLHIDHAAASMRIFCIRTLGFTSTEARLRLTAADLVRRFPVILDFLERGDIHLSGVVALRDVLTNENHEELLRVASRKSVRGIRTMIAARFPKPETACDTAATRRTNGRRRVELTITADEAKVERVRHLMRYSRPNADVQTIYDAALDALVAKLEAEAANDAERPEETRVGGEDRQAGNQAPLTICEKTLSPDAAYGIETNASPALDCAPQSSRPVRCGVDRVDSVGQILAETRFDVGTGTAQTHKAPLPLAFRGLRAQRLRELVSISAACGALWRTSKGCG